MENNKQSNKGTVKSDNKTKVASTDSETQKPVDDSFKTSPRKHRLSWETPHDEQMLDSNKLSPEREEGD
jgi:hypothetical protein